MRSFLLFIFVTAVLSQSIALNRVNSTGSELKMSTFFGKIRYTTVVDGITREYIVHVPEKYKGDIAVPLVFMLHGTSGSGDEFYENIGWKELSEVENFIVVYPSSLKYKINDEGENKTTTKWNTLPDANWTLQAGEKAQDDIKFLRTVIDEMKKRYKIDSGRIYLNGFSNGGSMAAKCSIVMGDVLAAVAQNAASFFIDTVYIPKRKMPVLYEVGNRDYGPGNSGPSVPMSLFDSLIRYELNYLNGRHHRIARNHIRNFGLDSNFVITGDSNLALTATFKSLTSGAGKGYDFHFVFIKNLAHFYPNGIVNKFDAPKVHWDWMKNYRLEESITPLYNITVNEGYGGGTIDAGKIVHVWAKEKDGKVFTHWTGDTGLLESAFEYHTKLTMPTKDINITANYANMTSEMDYIPINIKAATKNKQIYVYLPPKDKLKGLVWLLHGSEGQAVKWVNGIENRHISNRLMVAGYGLVAITSEEEEFGVMNTDNTWSYGFDSTLIDFANVRAIRDTFIKRGVITHQTPHISIGFSAGGQFSQFLGAVLNWRASVSHNAPGNESISKNSKVPFLHCISLNDNGSLQGPTGNQTARNGFKDYKDRNACASFYEFEEMPLYAERFDRSPLISENLSKAIFNELKTNGRLNANNYLISSYGELEIYIKNNLSKFPIIVSLSSTQINHVKDQIEVTRAVHQFKADFNGRSLDFIQNICSTSDIKDQILEPKDKIMVIPNPAFDIITIQGSTEFSIYTINGQLIKTCNEPIQDISNFKTGIYIIKADKGYVRFVKM